jgi:hypothetical protein
LVLTRAFECKVEIALGKFAQGSARFESLEEVALIGFNQRSQQLVTIAEAPIHRGRIGSRRLGDRSHGERSLTVPMPQLSGSIEYAALQ